jgi:hypothetical protein
MAVKESKLKSDKQHLEDIIKDLKLDLDNEFNENRQVRVRLVQNLQKKILKTNSNSYAIQI